MAATTQFYEQNGAATGTPPQGTTSGTVSNVDWKNIDDRTTPRANAPIVAGNNSFQKFNYLNFTGTFNQISDVLFAHTAGALGTGLTLIGKVTSAYITPTVAAISGGSDITAPIAIGSGTPMLLSPTSPAGTDAGATLTSAGYTQYFNTQMQTAASAAAGDTAQVTLTIQYNEN